MTLVQPAAAPAQRYTITEPGVYDMTPADYHADPVAGGSLNSSGARMLLPPSCPALYNYRLHHPEPTSAAFDLGSAAHRELLGIGPALVEVDADDWRTKRARGARDDAHAAGAVPLLAAQYAEVRAMVAAARAHPDVAALLADGRPEQALVWTERTGIMNPTPAGDTVWCRALLDWLPDPAARRNRLIIPEYKTTRSAEPDRLGRIIHDHGYHVQAAWYLRGARALALCPADRYAFVWIFQEKTPPYLVTVCQPSGTMLAIGDQACRDAVAVYAQCRASDHWPAYSESIDVVSLPGWVEAEYERTHQQ